MPLPSSGSISLSQIQTEFGGSNPISINEYYKGGAYVLTTDNAPNVPASGQIDFNDFWGAGKSVAPTSVEYLVVAGGAGGGYGRSVNVFDSKLGYDVNVMVGGGGGGAGGYRTATGLAVSAGTNYTVTVGAGGSSNSGDLASDRNGSNSVFSSITSTGGGGGGGYGGGGNAATGGSGGGGIYQIDKRRTNCAFTGDFNGNGAAGTSGQGNSGVSPSGPAGGGGGGAGAGGSGGNGGSGSASSITGSSVTRAGGGGGGARAGQAVGTGGSGGGGGGSNAGTATSGGANTGGGGGGGGCLECTFTSDTTYSGGNGGSGVVVIRYADTFKDAASTTGSPSYSNAGGYKVYTFTGSGSIQW